MTNAFGVELHSESVRWAAAEGVSETVIAAVLLNEGRPERPHDFERDRYTALLGAPGHARHREGRSKEGGRHSRDSLAASGRRTASQPPRATMTKGPGQQG